jgi:hypothetical protein
MREVMVRYRVKPDRAEENEALVRGVYEELDRTKPDGFRYATFCLDDGVTFVHVALQEGAESPLAGFSAFQRFQQDIADRCDQPPVVSGLRRIGSYGL